MDVPLAPLALILLAGMAGSFHCVGMCGGFACVLGQVPGATRGATLLRHLCYNTGRVMTYVFLGALGGALGAGVLAGEGGQVAIGQRLLAVLAGLLMVVMGLRLLGVLRHSPAAGNGPMRSVIAALRGVLHAPGHAAPLAFGVFNGFLPCPLVYAFLALAVAGADPLRGMLLMTVFGLGTFPAMLLAGGLGAWLKLAWRTRGVRIAGAFVMALGVLTVARGVVPLDSHGGHGMLDALAGRGEPAAVHVADPAHSGGHRH